jgi:hypothetical protein
VRYWVIHPPESDFRAPLAHDATNRVGVHAAERIERLFLVAAQGAKHRRIVLRAVAGKLKIGADALRGLRIDGEGVAAADLRISDFNAVERRSNTVRFLRLPTGVPYPYR